MSLIVLGTSSNAGKTTVAAMICRYLSSEGFDVAPFKAYNCSSICAELKDGCVLGIGQKVQAIASGIEPSTDMNPVLAKISNGIVDIYLNGKKDKDATFEYQRTESLKAYRRLSSKHEVIVCEGSGSPVEINRMEQDIANVRMMRDADIPAILVADIGRGGSFAAIYGTWLLMPDDVRNNMKGFVLNRFRGDASILKEGIQTLEELTSMRCLGVLRCEKIRIPEEDLGTIHDTDYKHVLDDLDSMISHAKSDGFDFESLKKIAL